MYSVFLGHKTVAEQIISTGRVARGWLGVSARDVVNDTTGAGAGAALVGLLRGGPADKAGLRAGDTVVAIDGKEVADTAALVAQTAALSPGTQVQFKVPARQWAVDDLGRTGAAPAAAQAVSAPANMPG